MVPARVAEAASLMMRYVERTNVTSAQPTPRYLWTDAFAVCNLLELARLTGEAATTDLALQLVFDVHEQLGRHRADDARIGWLSGLTEAEARAHPTIGGLRIGKRLPERRASETFDPDLEWERDGQYFHYLTKWMHALDQTTRATGHARYHVWACELAVTAHRAFVRGPAGARRMAWKMSIDLDRPLVPSTGQHDPVDGYVTLGVLDATGIELGIPGPSLAKARSDFAALIDPHGLTTVDALGIGGLLFDAYRLGHVAPDDELVTLLLDAAARGLSAYVARPSPPTARHRLAFRELGLVLGLIATSSFAGDASRLGPEPRRRLRALLPYTPLAGELLESWLRPEHRQTAEWIEHADINDVMLASCLIPRGLLDRPRRPTFEERPSCR